MPPRSRGSWISSCEQPRPGSVRCGLRFGKAEIKEAGGVRVVTPEVLRGLKKGTLRVLDRPDAAPLQERFDLPEDA